VFTLIFWQATAERAVKSFAQALAAMLGTGGVGLLDVAWTTSLSVAGMTALLSVLTSLSSVKIGDVGMPSLVSRAPKPAPGSPPVREPRLART
jgi:hypothetical protein